MWLVKILLLLSVAFSEDLPEKLVLSVGGNQYLKAPSHLPVRIANGKIIGVKDLGNRILVKGKKSGSTLLRLGSHAISIQVLPPIKFRLYNLLVDRLKDRLGLEVKIARDSLRVEGKLLRWSDWPQIGELYGKKIPFQFAARIHPLIQKEVEEHFKALMVQAGLPPARILFSPTAQAIISKEGESLKPLYRKLLDPFGIEVQVSTNAFALAPMVRVRITVTEIKKNEFVRFGISWPESYTASLVGGPLQGETLNLALQALETKGQGRILASPTLLCRSGKTATFLAGGEFPIKVAGFKSQSVSWKKYGLSLRIKPLANWQGEMSIELETEVSQIDPSHTIDGIPAILTSRIQSHFDIKGKRTIALSGMFKHDVGESHQGLPLLSSIPILGPLFSSQEYREHKSELVFFVTPEVVQVDP